MQSILIIVHAAPYGSERCLSALRLATALAAREDKPQLRLFLMSDATVAGLAQQNDGAGNAIPTLLAQLAESGVPMKLCRTCALARGIAELALLPGVTIGTLPELAQWTVEADKVLTF
ncbi:MAG: DsrE family protein [Comamonadaceae bacterium]|jgi:uncharacterized protein involved in oxidation of intracellular sulfur|nr:DsrE family protein [Comamonadaceae bacterium]